MYKILKNIEYGQGKMSDIDLLWNIQKTIDGTTICPLGDAAAWPVAAAIRHFRDEFEWHINNPEESQKRNFGLAHYADPRPVPAGMSAIEEISIVDRTWASSRHSRSRGCAMSSGR